jgi:PPOX class probable F420-dependent enzyme
MAIDLSSKKGARALERLRDEVVIWLTTAGERPQSVPVWFLWDGESLLVYSVPGKKVRDLERHPRVHLNFNSTPTGGDVVRFEATAEVLSGHPGADDNPDYLRKYEAHIKRLGMDARRFASTYSVAVRIRPDKLIA